MKYLLMIHANPAALDALSHEERDAIYAAHDAFVALTTRTGELVGFAALADPSTTPARRTARVTPPSGTTSPSEQPDCAAGNRRLDM
jgi:hypothetical protein